VVKLLGFAIAWAGYTLIWWGWSSLQGPGVGLMDLVIPGRVPSRSNTSASVLSSGYPQAHAPTTSSGILNATGPSGSPVTTITPGASGPTARAQ